MRINICVCIYLLVFYKCLIHKKCWLNHKIDKLEVTYKLSIAIKMSKLQTNNQSYGSHYKQSSSLNKQRMVSSTLDFLKQTDQKGYIHEQ
jgi:hypothetical protein